MHDDFGEQRKLWFHLAPDPTREIFARRIFQAGNLIQVVMIESIVRRLKRGFDIREIHDPTGVAIDVTAQVQLDPK